MKTAHAWISSRPVRPRHRRCCISTSISGLSTTTPRRSSDADGRSLRVSWGSRGDWPGALWNVHGMSVDQEGNLYLAEVNNGRAQKFRPRSGAGPGPDGRQARSQRLVARSREAGPRRPSFSEEAYATGSALDVCDDGVDDSDRGVVHRSGTATARRHTRSEPGRAGRYLVTVGLQRLPYAVHAERRAGFDADAVGTPSERPGESRTRPSAARRLDCRDQRDEHSVGWTVGRLVHVESHSDRVTGIGAWTEQLFIASIRNGKKSGTGRELLPPMPWRMYANCLTTT